MKAKVKTRTSKPKARTGCVTCKIRHVKCDERKPACLRCEKFGVSCDGYMQDVERPKAEKQKKRVVLRSLAPASKILLAAVSAKKAHPLPLVSQSLSRLQPSTSVPFELDRDYRYFKIFQECTALELSGYFDTNIWDRTILQICHQEQFAQHAVMALGALHATMDLIQGKYSSVKDEKELAASQHRLAALQHYGKSLKLARELTNLNSEITLKYTLLSCLLTTCFENYIGNQENALTAAQTGIGILHEKAASAEWCKPSEDLGHIVNHRSFEDNDLLTTFERLETSIIAFNTSRQVRQRLFPMYPQEGLARSHDTLNAPFSTVKEARLYTDYCVKRVLRWKIAYYSIGNLENVETEEDDHVPKRGNLEESSQRARVEYSQCSRTKAQWFRYFLPLYSATRRHPGSKEFLGASILMIQYLSASLISDLPEQDSEIYYDQYLHDQVAIIDLARELLETFPRTRSRRAVFAFDDGVVAGLFLTAVRCRDAYLRRQAIELLVKHPRREGLWDSAVAAEVAIWLMHREEEGILDGFVSEGARLRIVKMDPNLSERKVVVRCSKWDGVAQGRVDLDDVVLTW